jgi:hypothetical protein
MCIRFFTIFASGTGMTQINGPLPAGSMIGTCQFGSRASGSSRR